MDLLERKERTLKEQRKQTILRYLSSMVATVAVVAVAAVVISSTPVARFLDVEVFQNSVFYALEIENLKQEEDLNEFYVVLENQLYFEQREIRNLQDHGYFHNLNNSETYTLKIVGKGPFAQKTFDSKRIVLTNDASGTILDINWNQAEEDYMISFSIDVLFSDIKSQFKEVILEYRYQYLEFSETSETEQIILTEEYSQIELEPVYQENMILHVFLVGITHIEERVVLDTKSYQTPLFFHWELYIFTITRNSISGFAYHVQLDFVDTEYWLELHHGDSLLQQILMEEPQLSFNFEGLQGNTTYRIILRVAYPLESDVTEVILQEEVITTPSS